MKSKKVVENDGKAFERKNFVRINQNKSGAYKPAMRGAAFTNKIMAKKSNNMKWRGRMTAKIMAERSKNQVGTHGGLGAHGLDFGTAETLTKEDRVKEVEGSFSGSAQIYAPKFKDSEDEDEYLVNADMEEEIKNELKDIDEKVNSQEIENVDDAANYKIPEADSGYESVL